MTIRVATYGLLCIFTACSVPSHGALSPEIGRSTSAFSGTVFSGTASSGAASLGGGTTTVSATPSLGSGAGNAWSESAGGLSTGVGSGGGDLRAGTQPRSDLLPLIEDRPTRSLGNLATPNPAFDLSRIPQDQNYTPIALFTKTHGEFMLAREPWRPDVQASVLAMADVEVNGEPGDFNLRHARADIQRRIFISDPDSVITVGAQFGERDYEFTSLVPNGTHDESLYRASISLNYGRFLDENTLVEVEFNPGVWSDFSSALNHEDWQFYGKAMATWRYSQELFLVGGVEHSGLFRDLDVYPVAGLAWIPDRQWRLDVYLPRRIRLTHSPTEHTSIYFSVDLDGGDYEIESPAPRAPTRDQCARVHRVRRWPTPLQREPLVLR